MVGPEELILKSLTLIWLERVNGILSLAFYNEKIKTLTYRWSLKVQGIAGDLEDLLPHNFRAQKKCKSKKRVKKKSNQKNEKVDNGQFTCIPS